MVFGVFHTDGISWVQWMLDVGEGGVNPKPVHPAEPGRCSSITTCPSESSMVDIPPQTLGTERRSRTKSPRFWMWGFQKSGGTPCCLVNHDESKSGQSTAEDYKKIPVLEINNRSSQPKKNRPVLALGLRHPMLREFSHDSVKIICIQMINMAR